MKPIGKIYDMDKMTDVEIEKSFEDAISPCVKAAMHIKQMKDQVRYVPWPRRPWREPSPIEKLEIIREQIKINDLAPTDLMWMERDTILRRREAALMVELEKMKDMHSVRSDGAGTP